MGRINLYSVLMLCPYCLSKSKVTNSRSHNNNLGVWRRRVCTKCKSIWTTEERIQSSTAFKVSRDKLLLDFTPETLMISLYEALRHRKTAIHDAQHLSHTVITKLYANKQVIIPIELIKSVSHETLTKFDTLAADLYKATH